MKAIVTDGVYANLSEMLHALQIKDRQIPELKSDQLLIQIQFANVNPSDIAFLRGSYNVTKDFPAVPGFEACGIVIKTSAGLEKYQGQLVSCFNQDNSDGTWAEFTVVNVNQCLLLNKNFPVEQAASFFINPFTAYGLVELAIEKKAKCIIQNAAAGQVGKIVRFLAAMHGIKVINIVRRPQHIEKLINEGEEYVLNSRDKKFSEQLRELISLLNPTIAFDAVAGDFTSILFKEMPVESDIVVYGGLSGQNINTDVLNLIFEDKTIKGFNLNNWLKKSGQKVMIETSEFFQELIISGKIKTEIQRIVYFNEIYDGLYQYLTKMSDGKVLICPKMKN